MNTGEAEAPGRLKRERLEPRDRASDEELGTQDMAGSPESRQLKHQVSATKGAGLAGAAVY